MADHAPVMIWLRGPDQRFVWFNRGWLQFTGRTLKQELGDAWTVKVHPDDLERCLQICSSAFDAQRPFSIEYRLRRHDGAWRWVLDNGAPLHSPDQQLAGYVGSCSDVTEQKEVWDAFHDSEARERARAAELQAIMEAVPAVIWIARDPECQVITGNAASYEFLRLPREVNASKSAPEGDRPQNFEVFSDGRVLRAEELPVQRAARGEEVRNMEEEVRFDDGTSRYLLGNATPLRDTHGQVCGAVAAFVDITERKKAEQALRESEQRLQVALTAGRMGAWEWNIATGKIIWSPGLEQIHGLPAGTFGGEFEDFQRDIHPEDRADVLAQVSKTLDHREDYHVVYRIQPPTGGVRWLESFGRLTLGSDGKPQKLAGVCMDITERKCAEEALRHNEARFRAIFEQTSVGITQTDLRGHFVLCNDRFCQLLGRTREQLVQLTVQDVTHPEDWVANQPLFEKCAREGAGFVLEKRYLRPDGTPVWASSTVSLIRGPDGRPQYIQAISVDITQRKNTEVALAAAQAKLTRHAADLEMTVAERTAKLREMVQELETFSYSIAHDMRAPLRSMQGFGHFLLQEYSEKLDATGLGYLNRLTASAERMDRLIQDVLNYSQIVRAELSLGPVDLGRLLPEIIETYPAFHDAGTRITLVGPFPTVLGNDAALTQCVSNLLGNAIKFVGPGVTPIVRVWAETREGRARILVRDNGIGIDPDQHQKIFAIFERASTGYEGTGIGLAIVKKATERMRGSVGLESAPGQGSTFWIELELAEGAVPTWSPA